MKKINSLCCALFVIASFLRFSDAKAQNIFAISTANVAYNLPGSTGIVFDTMHTLSLPHWKCNGPGYSDIFVTKGFNFSLPANAHINGIMVQIDVIIHYLTDSSAVLLKHGVPYGTDGALHRHLNAAADISWGDTNTTWGGSWTAADINDTGFGLQFRVADFRSDSAFRWFDANPALITITYDTITALAITENNMPVPEPKIYPNPSVGKVNIDLGSSGDQVSVRLVNILGQVVSEVRDIKENEYVLNCSEQPKGVYFVEVSRNGQTSRTRLLLQ